MRELDVRLATRTGVLLWIAGSIMFAITALVEGKPDGVEVGVLVGVGAVMALALALADRTGRIGLGGVLGFELIGCGLVAYLVATTGGTDSPYAPYYLFSVIHAAVFQRRMAFLSVLFVAVAGFVAPLVYDSDIGSLRGVALVALLPVIATAVVINVIVGALRHERRHMAEREAEALRMAESDGLTGVGNYRRFWRSLQSEIARARRHGGAFSLIVMDLDGFKAINDRFGHQAGDEALRRVARGLQAELRTEDVLCRQGGDEFAVIAVEAGHQESSELGRRLVDAVARSGGRSQTSPALSASAGVATFGEPERTAEGLANAADRALRASRHGRWLPGAPLERPQAVRLPPPAPPDGDGDRLALLGAFARELALAGDERAVLGLAVTRVAEAMDARVVEVWTRRPPAGWPALAARGHHPAALTADGAAGAEALAAEATSANRVVIGEGPTPGETIMAVPVSDAGDTRGALVVATPRADLGARRLALALAAQLGRALAAAALRSSLAAGDPEGLRRLAGIAAGGDTDERVVELATGTARALRMDGDAVEAVGLAALLHGVGMLGIPAGLPLRPTLLSIAEQRVLHEHPLIAERMLRPIPRLAVVARILRCAHEHFDGNGYPDGLAGEQIPLESRVLHAAIAFAAMTAERPYRPALDDQEARTELRLVAGSQLDPVVVDALVAVLDEALIRRAAANADPVADPDGDPDRA